MSAKEKKYEDLFKDAAVALARVKQTRYILMGIDEGRFTASDVRPIIDFALRKLPNLVNDGQALIAKAQSMNPAEDLAAHPFKIGDVVGGVAVTIGSIGDGLTKISALLVALGALAS